MALTAEQKEANKAKRRERDRAYHKRYRERDDAEKAGLAEIASSDIVIRLRRAEEDELALEADRDTALAEIDRQIATLQAERKATADRYRATYLELRAATSAIHDEKRAAERELSRRLDQQFPDLIGDARWSAACWEHRRASLPATPQEKEQ